MEVLRLIVLKAAVNYGLRNTKLWERDGTGPIIGIGNS